MALLAHEVDFPVLDAESLAAWRGIPTAVASDCLNRGGVMAASVKPVAAGARLVGQALTIACMPADNSAIHAALRMAPENLALVIDGRGQDGAALVGGLLAAAALAAGAAGIVIDGAVRDTAELRSSELPVFASAATPAGPHKNFGGVINDVIACGGVAVHPGDIILGDDDGVAVVPLARRDEVLAAAQDKLAEEEEALRRLAAGETLADQYGVPAPGRAR